VTVAIEVWSGDIGWILVSYPTVRLYRWREDINMSSGRQQRREACIEYGDPHDRFPNGMSLRNSGLTQRYRPVHSSFRIPPSAPSVDLIFVDCSTQSSPGTLR